MKGTFTALAVRLTAIALFLAAAAPAQAQLDVSLLHNGVPVKTGYVRFAEPNTAVVRTLQVHSAVPLPVQLASTRQDIFSVPTSASTPVNIDVQLKEPSVPTLVKVTATVTTVAGALAQKTIEFTVYPRQKITEVSISPLKTLFQVGEPLMIHVRLAYPELTDSVMLAMPRPYGGSTSFHTGHVPWRPGPQCGSDIYPLTPACLYPIAKGKQSLDFPITTWHDAGYASTNWRIRCGGLYTNPWLVTIQACSQSGPDVVNWTVQNQNFTPTIRALRLDRTEVMGGESLGGSVEVERLAPGDSLKIVMSYLSDPGDVSFAPWALTAVGGAPPAPVSFTVSTSFVPTDRVARISASAIVNGVPSQSNQQTAYLKLRSLITGMDGLDRDLVAGEVRRVILRLSQPAPGPIVITLESSDPGRLSLPNEIRFVHGQREATLDLKVSATVDRLVPVTLKAGVGGRPRASFSTRVAPKPPA